AVTTNGRRRSATPTIPRAADTLRFWRLSAAHVLVTDARSLHRAVGAVGAGGAGTPSLDGCAADPSPPLSSAGRCSSGRPASSTSGETTGSTPARSWGAPAWP